MSDFVLGESPHGVLVEYAPDLYDDLYGYDLGDDDPWPDPVDERCPPPGPVPDFGPGAGPDGMPVVGPPDARRLHETAASGFGAWELDRATTDPTRICDRDVLDGIVGLDRVVAWTQARQTRLSAEFRTRRGDTPAAANETRPSPNSRFAPDELGIALRISRGAAAGRLGEALFLVEQLPEVLDLWATGRLDRFKVRIIADTVIFLQPDQASAVVARVLPKSPEQSTGQLRAALAKAILAVDPHGANARHRKARKDRRVSVNAQPEGMASLWAYLSAPDARAAWEWLTRLARGLATDDPRKMDARRADLLVALLTGMITFTNPDDDPDNPGTVVQNSPATAADPSGSDQGNVGQVADPGAADPGAADPGAADPGGGGPGAADPAAAKADSARVVNDAGTPGRATAGRPDQPDPTGTGTRAVRQPVQRARMRSATTTTPLPTPDDPTDPAPTDPPRPTRERINPVTPGKPLITVAVAYSTLTGADEHPGELAGYGPIPRRPRPRNRRRRRLETPALRSTLGHRPRPRTHHLPPTRRTRRPRTGAGPDLPRTALPQTRIRSRARPPHPLPRRAHLRAQPDLLVQAAP